MSVTENPGQVKNGKDYELLEGKKTEKKDGRLWAVVLLGAITKTRNQETTKEYHYRGKFQLFGNCRVQFEKPQ